MSNKPSTCKKCTSSNIRQIGELSHDEWLRRVNNQGWKGGRAGWIHAQSLVTMTHNQMMEFFRVGDTPYPKAWDEVKADADVIAYSEAMEWEPVKGKLTKNAYSGWTFTPDNNAVNVSAGIIGVLKDE